MSLIDHPHFKALPASVATEHLLRLYRFCLRRAETNEEWDYFESQIKTLTEMQRGYQEAEHKDRAKKRWGRLKHETTQEQE